jgi:hypothetical protein
MTSSIIKGCSGVFFIWADYYFFRTGKIFHLSGKLYIVLHLAEMKYIKRVDFGSVMVIGVYEGGGSRVGEWHYEANQTF